MTIYLAHTVCSGQSNADSQTDRLFSPEPTFWLIDWLYKSDEVKPIETPWKRSYHLHSFLADRVLDSARIGTASLSSAPYTGCFFYFGMFDLVIFWSIFDQKSCSWTFFISTFCSYFVKKITKHLCHYFSFYCIFRKVTNFWEIFKKNHLFWENYNKNAKISWFQQKFLLELLLSTANTVNKTKNTKKVSI